MDKKRKSDTPTLTPERGAEYRRKKTKRTEPDEVDSPSKEPEGGDQQPEVLTDEEARHSEASVKVRMGLGAKRTKKPPKSLENFICRPTIRVSQKPLPPADGAKAKSKSSTRLPHPALKKCNSDSPATKASTTMLASSPSSPEKVSPALDSPDMVTAKKVSVNLFILNIISFLM